MSRIFIIRGFDSSTYGTVIDRAYTSYPDAIARRRHLYKLHNDVPLMDDFVVDGICNREAYQTALDAFCEENDFPKSMINVDGFTVEPIQLVGDNK